uniref:Adenosine kinase n=1 Tax=Albugo laibachii Nc14 TaxID=890382 RepID=F0WG77_9STRA|nr:adenosine kinase putative [Albugo laibachii Nc14]|eukprot:CCA20212.1 adenosine kinase putative [Albugo laibachii Nc14]
MDKQQSMAEAEQLTYSIVGLGNPLLDISANVSQELLDKYKLRSNDAILASDCHLPLYGELTSKYSPEFMAGGATQNSIRVAQWMLSSRNGRATTFMGSIGNDEHGRILKECAERDGVRTHYLVQDTTPTGTCAVCVKGDERSLVANLSAANEFHHDHLDNEKSKEILENGRLFYSSGFHLTVSPTSVLKIAEHAHEKNKTFLLNLAAPFVMQFYKEPLMNAIKFADFMFGNETEALEFGKLFGWSENLQEIALKMTELPVASSSRKRVVVITQGSEPTIVALDGKVTLYDVTSIDSKEIKDTNGAGDAFVGGFISRLALGRPLPDCIKAGQWAAGIVIRRSGCTFPQNCEYSD